MRIIIDELKTADDPLALLEDKIDSAIHAYSNLTKGGVTFETESGVTQVERYKEAISIYKSWKNDII